MKGRWTRVSRQMPCPICQKPDWCTIGEKFICCMRIDSGLACSNGGWLHRFEETRIRPLPARPSVEPEYNVDIKSFWDRWSSENDLSKVLDESNNLGVSFNSLIVLGCAWVARHNAFAFPMHDDSGEIIGIRFRDASGKKWALKGSRNGLFIPTVEVEPVLYICEGPTDTSAALSLGLYAIGRPSCSSCVDMVVNFISRNKIRKVIIVSDNDDPGINGAEVLSSRLNKPHCIVIPPKKDIREFVSSGGTRAVMDCIVNSTLWRK